MSQKDEALAALDKLDHAGLDMGAWIRFQHEDIDAALAVVRTALESKRETSVPSDDERERLVRGLEDIQVVCEFTASTHPHESDRARQWYARADVLQKAAASLLRTPSPTLVEPDALSAAFLVGHRAGERGEDAVEAFAAWTAAPMRVGAEAVPGDRVTTAITRLMLDDAKPTSYAGCWFAVQRILRDHGCIHTLPAAPTTPPTINDGQIDSPVPTSPATRNEPDLT